MKNQKLVRLGLMMVLSSTILACHSVMIAGMANGISQAIRENG